MTIKQINPFETLVEFEEGKLMEYVQGLIEAGVEPTRDAIWWYETQMLREREHEAPYHQHPDKKWGGSDFWGCIKWGSHRMAHLPIPRYEGRRAKMGDAHVGIHWHGKIVQPAIETSFNKEPLDGTHYNSETHVKVKIPDTDLTVVSPVDCGFLDQPVQETEFEFKDGPLPVKVAPSGANWQDIGDIKSTSDNYFNKYKEEGLPNRYKARGHVYMYATGLEFIRFQRMLQLVKILKKTGKALYLPTDLAYITSGSDFECTYICKLSEVKEVPGRTDMALELVKPCAEACKVVIADAVTRFREGTLWFDRNSQITINYIDEQTIEYTNKSGKAGEMTPFAAMKKLKPRAICPKCGNTGCKLGEYEVTFTCPGKTCGELFEVE
jgi:hypothetical protein